MTDSTGGTQQEVIEFLASGAAFGIGSDAVRRIDTHCSVIFLLKDRAFKLKQAIKFSYLDYTDVAERGRFTQAELDLNRRTAPELYLQVHKVVRDAGGKLRLASGDEEGEALDWILEMRRFADDGLFASLADANRLTPALMQELADAIHHFHDRAEQVFDHGSARAVGEVLADCGENLRQHAPPLARPRVEEVMAVLAARLAAIAPLLEQRRRDGMVRRCHGDLHLGNICLFDNRPVLFDCIEFSDDISCIDVFYDLAFVLMDLCHRDDHHAALANILLNRYLDRGGDIGGLAALPFFLALRAAIRSHILAGGSKHQDDPAIAEKKRNEAIAYLATAARLIQSGAPRLIALGGLSGSGKSSLARQLAPFFSPAPGARIIRSDTLRKRLQNVAPEERLPASAYGQAMTDRVYEEMLHEAAVTLEAGYTVILDATYLRERERQAAEDVARYLGRPFQGVWLDVPKDILARRIAARRGDASDADLSVLEQQLTYELGPVTWQSIDAGGTPAEVLGRLREIVLG